MQVTAEMLEDARVTASVPPVAPDLSGAVIR
jgi:multidrug resistance efflux pump